MFFFKFVLKSKTDTCSFSLVLPLSLSLSVHVLQLVDLPSIRIYDGALDLLLELYKQVLVRSNSYLTKNGKVDWESNGEFSVFSVSHARNAYTLVFWCRHPSTH